MTTTVNQMITISEQLLAQPQLANVGDLKKWFAKNEPWRYVDMGFLDTPFVLESKVDVVVNPGYDVVFRDGNWGISSNSTIEITTWTSLSSDQKGALAIALEALPIEENPFVSLSKTAVNEALVLIAKGKTDGPVRILLDATSPSFQQPVLFFWAMADSVSQVSLTVTGSAQLLNVTSYVVIEARAELSWVSGNPEGISTVWLDNSRILMGTESKFHSVQVVQDVTLFRSDVDLTFSGPNAHASLNGLAMLDGKSRAHAILQVRHIAKDCESQQLFKNILSGESVGEYNGLVRVVKGAQGTFSEQRNRNLLLSDKAHIYARPQLRIDANDVKCAHGSTTGQLSEEAVFYLATRGLSLNEARSLLVYGFGEEVLLEIRDPRLKELFEIQLKTYLNRLALADTQVSQ